ncbi:pkd domain containing protein [Colletotrichum truncatum]|uniref:Pkd domain containing protein n=1 Tax=Colletotrichum truncatum TaxID=5467 RepID=A0ACC3ZCY4_COLTU|nr:pkd domain containing protein [Colletotrichum truncatum]KAF6797955.1 pkd domain containing protein [Colletotrichum truncatum]
MAGSHRAWSLLGAVLTIGFCTRTAHADLCAPLTSDGPVLVTPNCTDANFTPIIDGEMDQPLPIAHRRVSGYINETGIRFTISLPKKDLWEGRFFQLVYPTQTENATDETIAFGADSGGYTVQLGGGTGYQANAAVAKLSRQVASTYYQHNGSIYGYIYGGSGGSLQTAGAMENTQDVWNGAVPIIQAIPISFMNNPTPRGLAGIVLRNKSAEIEDALKPGGSMDPYANLNPVQHQILEEVTKLGNPLESWQDFDAIADMTDLSKLNYDVRGIDTTYADDFWNTEGYLGTEKSPLGDLLRSRLVNQSATITSITYVDGKPTNVTIDNVPPQDLHLGLDFALYSKNGTEIGLIRGALNGSTIAVEAVTSSEVLHSLKEGLQVRVDNRWFIAMHAYYRHQVPSRDGYYAWDYLRNSSGAPVYVQRPIETSVLIAKAAAGGGTHTGKIRCKIIVIDNLLDEQAYPWHADWYRGQVVKSLGDTLDQNYRLWYNEHADHDFGAVTGARASRVIEFTGLYQQALRDLAMWVEKGQEPPRSTNYTISPDAQVKVPANVSERYGIQPSVTLSLNGTNRFEAASQAPVSMTVHAEVPPNTGSIVAVEWDYLGIGEFVSSPLGAAVTPLSMTSNYTYSQPGTYFPAVRITSQREGNMTSPFGRVSNLGRGQVIVS